MLNWENIKKFSRENKVLLYYRSVFNIDNTPEQMLLENPYYRFIRTILLIEKLKIEIKPSHTWLDLGCHHGQFLSILDHYFNCKTIGMDDWPLKKDMPWTKFDYFRADLGDPSWVENLDGRTIEHVSAMEVIEHIIHTDVFLINIGKVMKKNGTLLITTPNINSLRNRIRVPLGLYPHGLECRTIVHHVRLFNKTKLIELLEETGFEVKYVCGVNGLPARLLKFVPFRLASELLAQVFPTLCGNLIVIATKK